MSSIGLPDSVRRSAVVTFFRRIIKEKPLGTVGAAITALLLLVGLFARRARALRDERNQHGAAAGRAVR